MPGTTIGRHCTIGAGCLLTGKIADETRLVSMGVKSIKV
jgi:acetyltransferase-like isoleucine patch superfamily enzyme